MRAIRAHPRSRGENLFIKSGSGANDGSSPLTRGKHSITLSGYPLLGLIPAHAGKTGNGPPRTVFRWAHPRSRGENVLVFIVTVSYSGSSPLTRGKPNQQ